ncbi:AAA family ATPase, partial [Shewanella algae]
MLIEFNITNFRSIKERQTLSLSRAKYGEKEESNTFSVAEQSLLRSAVIYGPNASGKSNIINALGFMRSVVLASKKVDAGDLFDVAPFRLNAACREHPSEFEVSFIQDDIRYQYGFSVVSERVIEEWLFAFPKGRAQRWFSREYDASTDTYEWYMGNALQGQKQVWLASTRPNSLFLSTAVSLNSTQLEPVFNWFRKVLKISMTGNGWGPLISSDLCENQGKDQVLNFLKAADMDIVDIQILENQFDPGSLPNDMPSVFRESLIEEFRDKKILEFKTIKNDDEQQPVEFDLESEESDGTQKLFALAGPWIRALKDGHVLVIDELHLNLHSKLMSFLIEMFHDSKINTGNGQLIFTSHDTNVMSQN